VQGPAEILALPGPFEGVLQHGSCVREALQGLFKQTIPILTFAGGAIFCGKLENGREMVRIGSATSHQICDSGVISGSADLFVPIGELGEVTINHARLQPRLWCVKSLEALRRLRPMPPSTAPVLAGFGGQGKNPVLVGRRHGTEGLLKPRQTVGDARQEIEAGASELIAGPDFGLLEEKAEEGARATALGLEKLGERGSAALRQAMKLQNESLLRCTASDAAGKRFQRRLAERRFDRKP